MCGNTRAWPGLLATLLLVGRADPLETELFSDSATTRISSMAELKSRIARARPGDVLILDDGKYTATADTVVDRAGTASAPIIITAQSIGGVELTGTHGITFGSKAAFVQIRGFHFRNATGSLRMPSGSHHCR